MSGTSISLTAQRSSDGRLDSASLPTHTQEAGAFWRMRGQIAFSTIRETIHQSRLRVSLVVGLSLFFWFGLFILFVDAFRFIDSAIGDPDTHAIAVQRIYSLFFASLMIMLIVSTAIILYSGLYRTREAGFLLTTPVRPERIVLHKFQEAILFSTWGFLLLGSPMLVAYGVEEKAPWIYFVLLVPFMLSFLYIPASIGAILCLVVTSCLPRFRKRTLTALWSVLVALVAALAWQLIDSSQNNILSPPWFQEKLARLQFTEGRLLPNYWLSAGLLESARRGEPGVDYYPWAQSVMFLTVLISNGLMGHVVLMWTAARLYRRSYSDLHGEPTRRRAVRGRWLDRWVLAMRPIFGQSISLLLVKDLRIFRRDPVQWSQFLISFGLLALYFVNIRRLSYDLKFAGYINMISFLNLAVVGLILSTFTTRFIFPMISLEGRRFWILGLLPIDRESILWGKFLFAAVGSTVPCTVLIMLSDLNLQISPLVLAIHQLTCIVLCLGLSGIAVGLGACMPNLREESPSKIAAGFGGTLNLVISAAYIVVVVLLTALPSHFYLAAEMANLLRTYHRVWLFGGALAAVALGLLATWLPMRLGLRAFKEMEL